MDVKSLSPRCSDFRRCEWMDATIDFPDRPFAAPGLSVGFGRDRLLLRRLFDDCTAGTCAWLGGADCAPWLWCDAVSETGAYNGERSGIDCGAASLGVIDGGSGEKRGEDSMAVDDAGPPGGVPGVPFAA